ncbi:MAG TPA: hypothetical protein PKL14_12720 [Holophaga sp.]|nr:hypothetical protein [Holophaga sp.]
MESAKQRPQREKPELVREARAREEGDVAIMPADHGPMGEEVSTNAIQEMSKIEARR